MSGGEVKFSNTERTRSATRTNAPAIVRAFAVCDKFGRRIGARVYVGTETFRPVTEAEAAERIFSWSRVPAGTWFYFCPQATRNGDRYGACQPDRYFETEAARDAAVDKYLAAAEKRASKVRGAVAVQS